MKSILMLGLLFLGFVLGSKNQKDINNFFANLTYNPAQVLSQNLTSKGQILSKKFVDIGILAFSKHKTFPGAFLLANQRLRENDPVNLVQPRRSLKYKVDLLGPKNGIHFKAMPIFHQYNELLQKVLDLWFEKFSSKNLVKSGVVTEGALVKNQEQLRVVFGKEFEDSDVEMSLDFKSVIQGSKNIALLRIRHIFYTVKVHLPKKPAGFFDPSVRVSRISKRVNSSNPLLVVEQTSYGKTAYLQIETASSMNDMQRVLKDALANEDFMIKDLKNLTIQVHLMKGGMHRAGRIVEARTLKEAKEVIAKNGEFSRNNLGYPITYRAKFVQDQSQAFVELKAESEGTSTVIPSNGTFGKI